MHPILFLKYGCDRRAHWWHTIQNLDLWTVVPIVHHLTYSNAILFYQLCTKLQQFLWKINYNQRAVLKNTPCQCAPCPPLPLFRQSWISHKVYRFVHICPYRFVHALARSLLLVATSMSVGVQIHVGVLLLSSYLALGKLRLLRRDSYACDRGRSTRETSNHACCHECLAGRTGSPATPATWISSLTLSSPSTPRPSRVSLTSPCSTGITSSPQH